jgi:hypothetical protein
MGEGPNRVKDHMSHESLHRAKKKMGSQIFYMEILVTNELNSYNIIHK